MGEELEKLTMLILEWWDKHQYDCDGSYNRYNEPPPFVQEALRIYSQYHLLWNL